MNKIFRNIYRFLFPKMIDGKGWIEESMTAKYGTDWLDQCIEGLKNEEIRKQLRKDLNLETNNK
jgi:hypothetical protein